jgi:hypothetical protein
VTLYGGSSKPERLAGYADAGIERVVLWVQQGSKSMPPRSRSAWSTRPSAAEAVVLGTEARHGA